MVKKIAFFITILWLSNCYSQLGANEIVGKINVQKKDNFLILRAQIINRGVLHIDELKYNLVALKKGKSGNYSKNNQSGEFSVEPREEKYLSSLRVNLNNEDELRAFLFIKYKDKLVHRDTLFIASQKRRKVAVKKNKETEFFLKGIVLDEAITKIGKDFHDLFFQKYLLTGRKYPFIIKIKEKPTVGRSSVIVVEAEDTKLHEFFARPEEEYLESKVDYVLKRLMLYSRQRKSIMKNKKI